MNRKNVIIIGAAGRDFHNFNTYFRENKEYRVVAFTAAQIPDIDGRKYPKELAGEDLYPEGIPIYVQSDLKRLIKELSVETCVFAYSDVPYQRLMNISAEVNAAGANFMLLGPDSTMIKSTKPFDISMCSQNRLRQEPNIEESNRNPHGNGFEGCSNPASYALWKI